MCVFCLFSSSVILDLNCDFSMLSLWFLFYLFPSDDFETGYKVGYFTIIDC